VAGWAKTELRTTHVPSAGGVLFTEHKWLVGPKPQNEHSEIKRVGANSKHLYGITVILMGLNTIKYL
jgi:hypothetical protein